MRTELTSIQALATAIASGAELAYLPEVPPTLHSLQRDIDALVYAFKNKQHRGLIVNNEEASHVFTTNTLTKLYEDQSQGKETREVASL